MKLFLITADGQGVTPTIATTLFECIVKFLDTNIYTKTRRVNVEVRESAEAIAIRSFRDNDTLHYILIADYREIEVDGIVPAPVEPEPRPVSKRRPASVRIVQGLLRADDNIVRIFIDKRRSESPNNIDGYRIKAYVRNIRQSKSLDRDLARYGLTYRAVQDRYFHGRNYIEILKKGL